MKDNRGGKKMRDTIEIIGKGSLIQHGKLNDRVYLMKLDERDIDIIIDQILKLANTNNYSKLFCKVTKSVAPIFFANGFILEAYIPKFYGDSEDVFFVSKFLKQNRIMNVEDNQLSKLKHLLSEDYPTNDKLKNKSIEYDVRKLTKSDVEQITQIYTEVFESYPFPIHNSNYILETMSENVQYFGAEKDGELVALASSEIDQPGKNAEMTDFATLDRHGGNNLASLLLKAMEKEMRKIGIKTLYTIARLNSIPMNKTFLRFNYEYSGTLIKNTNISGKIESMNIYYKHI